MGEWRNADTMAGSSLTNRTHVRACYIVGLQQNWKNRYKRGDWDMSLKGNKEMLTIEPGGLILSECRYKICKEPSAKSSFRYREGKNRINKLTPEIESEDNTSLQRERIDNKGNQEKKRRDKNHEKDKGASTSL